MATHPRTDGTGVSRRPRRDLLREHAFFLCVLFAGVVLRVLDSVAYRPVLYITDSVGYVDRARHLAYSPVRPGGYSVFLWPLMHGLGGLPAIPVLQHILGVALAAATYVLLIRRNLSPVLAGFAAAALLLDPLQLVLEQYALSDLLFEVLVAGACLLLAWFRRPPLWATLAAGLMAGLAGLVRGAGLALIAVMVVGAVALTVPWRRVIAMALVGVLPLAAYMIGYHGAHGRYAVVESGPRFLYARLAPFADCTSVALGKYERQLCPKRPIGQRPTSDWFMWGHQQSAQYHLLLPPGAQPLAVIADFDKRILRHQPIDFARHAAQDFFREFRFSRTSGSPGFPPGQWLFHDHYWSYDIYLAKSGAAAARKIASINPSADVSVAKFLTGYQRYVYVPGPVLLVLLLIAAAATLGVGRSRRSGQRAVIGLYAGTILTVLVTAVALAGASWRYVLPQLALIPPAGLLGLTALIGRADPLAPAPWSFVDRVARGLGRSYRLTGFAMTVVVAALVIAGGLVSGYCTLPTAAVLGAAVAAVFAVGVERGSRRRDTPDGPPPPG